MLTTQNIKKQATLKFETSQLTWALGSVCVLHQRNFSPEMLAQEFPPEISASGNYYSESTLMHAAQRLGFRVKRVAVKAKDFASLPLPVLVKMSGSPPPRSHCTRRY